MAAATTATAAVLSSRYLRHTEAMVGEMWLLCGLPPPPALPPITVAVRALRPAASGTTVSWGNTASFELMKTSARPGTLPSLALAVERGWRG